MEWFHWLFIILGAGVLLYFIFAFTVFGLIASTFKKIIK